MSGACSAWAGTDLAPNVRRVERGYVRDIPGETLSGGGGAYLHLAGPDDVSAAHVTYPRGYDSRCGWCYLGAPHTADAHAAKVQEDEGRG